jgi:hypothetical protein
MDRQFLPAEWASLENGNQISCEWILLFHFTEWKCCIFICKTVNAMQKEMLCVTCVLLRNLFVCVHNSVYIGLCKIVPCIGSKWLENDVLYIRSHISRFVHHVVLTWSLSSLSEDFIEHNFIFYLLLVWNLPLRGGGEGKSHYVISCLLFL